MRFFEDEKELLLYFRLAEEKNGWEKSNFNTLNQQKLIHTLKTANVTYR